MTAATGIVNSNIFAWVPANLQGALGKISGRSYKAAPRQLLQVESSAEAREGAAKEAADLGRAALADAAEVGFYPVVDDLGDSTDGTRSSGALGASASPHATRSSPGPRKTI